MFRWLSKRWQMLKAGAPGKRFQEFHERRQQGRRTPYQKPLVMALGGAIIVAGVVMLAVPGPGLLAIVLGAALFAEESRVTAKALDGCEVGLRHVVRWVYQRMGWRPGKWLQETRA